LDMAAACREQGNSLFLHGNYPEAVAAYTEGLQQLQQQDPARSTLLSNRAACHLALGDAAAAEADCRAGLAISPANAKLHYRLATSLARQQQHDTPEAAAAIAAAVALLQPEQPSPQMLHVYNEIAAATAAAAEFQGVRLPASPAEIAALQTQQNCSALLALVQAS
jgi:tetratricopeptide (TPR) repeat protein